MLLVLDNCEHLTGLDRVLAGLQASAPGLVVLATSRAPVSRAAEHSFPVPPLALPDLHRLPPPAALAAVPSVALLVVRAQAVDPRFALTAHNAHDAAEICVRLDGLPLAIELAAARLPLLSPRDLVRRLDRALTLLTRGTRDASERHQTLRATIEWSYGLLSFQEQRWFECCGVFVGGWTVQALEALDAQLNPNRQHQAADDPRSAALQQILAALVDKSLVQVAELDDGEPRYTMLETIRQFAVARLHERGSDAAVTQAHAQYYRRFIERIEADGVRPNTPEWITPIERDHDNLRTALRCLLDTGDIEAALQLGSSLLNWWYMRDYEREGRRWMEELVARSTHIQTLERAKVVYKAALLAAAQGDMDQAVAHYEATLRMCQDLPLATLHASARSGLAIQLCRRGNYAGAVALLDEALDIARRLDKPAWIGLFSNTLAGVVADQGQELERAIALYEAGLAIFRELHDTHHVAAALSGLGQVLVFTGSYARAATVLAEALEIQHQEKARGAMCWTLQYLGVLAYMQARYAQAQQHFRKSLTIAAENGSQNTLPMALEGLAGVAVALQQPTQAARLLGTAEALREAIQLVVPPLEQGWYRQVVDQVRQQLAAAPLRTAWQAGRSLSVPQILAEVTAWANGDAPVERGAEAEMQHDRHTAERAEVRKS